MSGELVILGAGESGTGAALLAKAKGLELFVSDNRPIADVFKKELILADVPFEEGGHSVDRILKAGEVVKSPGIPEEVDLIKRLRQKGVPVVSEIEFGGRYNTAHLIGVTGSNGKTTTVTWITHILKGVGMDVEAAGNVGQSFARKLLQHQPKAFVLELSSFQLDDVIHFKCDTSLLLNITPDHLNRYGFVFDNYVQSKFRILQNQGANDDFIYCADDKVITNRLKTIESGVQQWPFSYHKPQKTGAWVEQQQLVFNLGKEKISLPLESLALKGVHNVYNAMAAGLAALRMGISSLHLVEGLTHFRGVEHRMERVAEVQGILFINDSKATNVDSTWYALDSMTRPVIWIAGGTDKGNDYAALLPLVRKKVKALICLGVDNRKLISSFGSTVDQLVEADSMPEALQHARKLAARGDVVLLSPACASFDLFDNYEHRGKLFKLGVAQLLTE